VFFRLFESKGWLDAGGSFFLASMLFRRLRARFLHNRALRVERIRVGAGWWQCVGSLRTCNCLRLGVSPEC
jgi:hypothetical protein